MTLTSMVIKNIIRKLLHGEDYRDEVLTLLNAQFLQYAIEFFKQVASAKYEGREITEDWYKATFLNEAESPDDMMIYAGLNKKTIFNAFGTTRRWMWWTEGFPHERQRTVLCGKRQL